MTHKTGRYVAEERDESHPNHGIDVVLWAVVDTLTDDPLLFSTKDMDGGRDLCEIIAEFLSERGYEG